MADQQHLAFVDALDAVLTDWQAKCVALRARLAEVEDVLRWILRSDLCHIPIGLRQRAGEALATTEGE